LKEVDIHEGIEDTLTIVHHELKNKATVERNFGDIPPISCYPSQLNQVFLNLLMNAVQAIEGVGKITITTFQKNNQVYIQFEDDGVGIPEEALERIFVPGYTTKDRGAGTGLGLSICHQIIKDHNGDILVESEVGKGTTFTVVLPMDVT
jgi:two-component system NtrC family sensor kinase